MARVPVYQQQVQRAPIRGGQINAQMSPDGAGAAMGGALSQAGGQIAQIAQQERQKADQLAVLEADNQLAEFETNRLYDPENGALNRRGRDAFGLPDEVMEEYEKTASQIEGNLSSDRQRQAFQRAKQQRANSINLTIQRHVSRQMQEHDDQTTNSSLEMSRQNALNNFTDPERIELEVARQHALIADHAERNGLPAEYVQQKRLEVDGATYTAVIERMASESPMEARKFYEQNKEHIKGEWDAKANTIIDTKVKAYEADDAANEIAMNAGDKQSDWIKAANEIEDPEKRQMVRQALNQRWQEVEVARNEQATSVFDQIEEGARPRDIDADVWMELTPRQRQTAETRYRQLQEGNQVNNDREYAQFLGEYGQNPRELAKLSSSELYERYRNNFDSQHWDRVLTQWQNSRNAVAGDQSARMEVSNTVNFNTAVQASAAEFGVVPVNESASDWSEEQTRRFNSFEQSSSEAIFMKEQELGRKLYPHEIRRTIDEMAGQQVITESSRFLGRFSDPIPAAAMLPDETPEAVPFEDIPDNAIVQLQGIYEGETNRQMNMGNRNDKQRLQRAYLYYRMIEGVEVPERGTDEYREYMQIAQSISDILGD